jgi:hypothetical protein
MNRLDLVDKNNKPPHILTHFLGHLQHTSFKTVRQLAAIMGRIET